MSSTKRDVSPPNDVWRALLRMGGALVGLVLATVGVVWLLNSGSVRWPAYLGRAALVLIPAGLLLATWQRLHMAAGRRVVARTSWTERDAPQYGWRIEAAIVGALLSLVTVAAAIGSGVHAVEAFQRSSWNEVEATYVQRETCDTTEDNTNECPESHRLVMDDDTEVFVATQARSWPQGPDLPGATLTVHYEGDDLETAESESWTELAAIAAVILLAAVPMTAGAWTVLSEAAYGPPKT